MVYDFPYLELQMKFLNLKFLMILFFLTSVLFASIGELISHVHQSQDKIAFIFKLKGDRSYKLMLVQDKKEKGETHQQVFLQTMVQNRETFLLQNPVMILNTDSSIYSTIIHTLHDSDDYELSVKGRYGPFVSQTLQEFTQQFSLDQNSERTFCSFFFASTTDSALKCTVRLEAIK